MTPEVLLQNFDPSPAEYLQNKIDYYFLPYSPQIDCSKHMRFHSEQREELTRFLLALYVKKGITASEKNVIRGLLSKIEMGDNKILSDGSKWELLYKFVFSNQR